MPDEAKSNLPSAKEYLVFDLAIERAPKNKYNAHVRVSPAGETSGIFDYEIVPTDLERLRIHVLDSAQGNKSVTGPSEQERKTFGGNLYHRVFTSEVHALFQGSLIIAEAKGKNLRLRLNLSDTPELAELPWELLYDEKRNRFFSLSSDTPLVRFFDLPEQQPPLRVSPPLRILVLVSPGEGQEQSANREWENLVDSLQPLSKQGIVELERVDKTTIRSLQPRLRQREYHVLHYIGHSTFDEATGNGSLFLYDDAGTAIPIRGDKLAVLLHDHEPLRLVILNSSQGARSDRDNFFGGIAPALIQQGIPAVIAMQSDISYEAAKLFAREFYKSLVDNYPIDAALIEGRRAIYFEGNEAEWATPVLYLRAPDGILFNVRAVAETPRPLTPAPAVVPQTESLTLNQLVKLATTAQKRAEQLWQDEPAAEPRWRSKFEEAYGLLARADKLTPDIADVLLRMAQIQAHLDPEYGTNAKSILYRLEDLIGEPMDDNQVRILAEAFFLHATLSEPPSEKLLQRARPLFQQLNDAQKLQQIDAQLQRVSGAVVIKNSPSVVPFSTQDFNPIGNWNIQVQDMVGSRLSVEFQAKGTFEMKQKVGMYEVPVTGNWNFNPLTHQLALQGVVNTFQPFILSLTLGNPLPNGFTATGSDGIGYVLTRAT